MSVLVVAATALAVVVWMRRLCRGYASDYDIEEYLGGTWMQTGFGGCGKACWTEKVLRGRWHNMSVLIRLTFWRRSLLSFGERLLVLAASSGGDLPDSPEQLAHVSHSMEQRSADGVWHFAFRGPACAVGRAEYRVPVCRIVHTPTQMREGLDRVLMQLQGILR